MKKIIALTLALLFLIPAAVACAETSDPSGTTENQSAETAAPGDTSLDTSHLYDEEGYLKSDLPSLNYGGETVTVLYWSDVEMQEYEAEEINSILVNDAIYKRNANVEATLNIEFEWLSTPGNNGKTTEFVAYVDNIYNAAIRISTLSPLIREPPPSAPSRAIARIWLTSPTSISICPGGPRACLT